MLLGSILQDDTILEEITVQPKHFTHEHTRNMFKVMLELHRKEKDISFISLTSQPDTNISKMGGLDHIAEIMNATPSANAFRKYEQDMKEYHTIELARKQASEFLQSTNEITDISYLNTYLTKTTDLEVNTVQKQETFLEKLHRRAAQHMNSPTEGLSGLETGYYHLNRQTDGWQKDDLIIVAGRPSMGKTAFVLDSLVQSSRKYTNLFPTFFSIEMSQETVIDRMVASIAEINVSKMRNPNKTFDSDEWNRYNEGLGVLEKINFDIRDENTVQEMRAAVRRNMKQHPDKDHIVAIDYLTLMKSVRPTGNRTYDIEEIIVGLKEMARQLHIPVIVLSQLSRGVEQRDDKRPNMGDLRDSGAIEQAADLIVMLYRDEYYYPDSNDRGLAELNFVKNRNGPTGTIKMKFDKRTNKFSDNF